MHTPGISQKGIAAFVKWDQTPFTNTEWISLLHALSPFILHFLPELISSYSVIVLLVPKNLSHTERVLTACHACEKAEFSSSVLQHVHLTDSKVEAAETRQGWECCFKGPLCWGAWQAWCAKEPSVEQCLAMCIIITALADKFPVSSCAVLAAVLKSKAAEQILHSVNVNFGNPFYVQIRC